MGVHGNQRVEVAGQELPHDSLADGLAGVEGLVLPHVAQVGRDQG